MLKVCLTLIPSGNLTKCAAFDCDLDRYFAKKEEEKARLYIYIQLRRLLAASRASGWTDTGKYNRSNDKEVGKKQKNAWSEQRTPS